MVFYKRQHKAVYVVPHPVVPVGVQAAVVVTRQRLHPRLALTENPLRNLAVRELPP
ncbi:hypothetical protein PC116_g29583 [Phytophthora cactorum]|nr:hypothetical protein PC116_g29583 [Phytophthora cactorum]